MGKRLTITFDGDAIIDREVHEIESEENAGGEVTVTARFDPIPLDCSNLTGQFV